MSIVFSIIRITNQSGCGIHQRITYIIAGSFACMWAGLVAQKINICLFHACQVAGSVALSQLVSQYIFVFSGVLWSSSSVILQLMSLLILSSLLRPYIFGKT